MANHNYTVSLSVLTDKMEKSLERARQKIKDLTGSTKHLDNGLATTARSTATFGSTLEKLRHTALGTGAAVAAIGTSAAGGVQTLLQTAREADKANTLLRNTTTNAKQYAREQQFIKKLAAETGQEQIKLTQEYAKVKTALTATGEVSLSSAQKQVSSLAKTFTALGLSSAESRQAFQAWQQMAAKGKVMSEELRQQLGEKIPVAIPALSSVTGLYGSELEEALQKGQIKLRDIGEKWADEMFKGVGGKINLNSIEALDNLGKNKILELTLNLKVDEGIRKAKQGFLSLFDFVKSNFIAILGTIAAFGAKKLTTSNSKGYKDEWVKANPNNAFSNWENSKKYLQLSDNQINTKQQEINLLRTKHQEQQKEAIHAELMVQRTKELLTLNSQLTPAQRANELQKINNSLADTSTKLNTIKTQLGSVNQIRSTISTQKSSIASELRAIQSENKKNPSVDNSIHISELQAKKVQLTEREKELNQQIAQKSAEYTQLLQEQNQLKTKALALSDNHADQAKAQADINNQIAQAEERANQVKEKGKGLTNAITRAEAEQNQLIRRRKEDKQHLLSLSNRTKAVIASTNYLFNAGLNIAKNLLRTVAATAKSFALMSIQGAVFVAIGKLIEKLKEAFTTSKELQKSINEIFSSKYDFSFDGEDSNTRVLQQIKTKLLSGEAYSQSTKERIERLSGESLPNGLNSQQAAVKIGEIIAKRLVENAVIARGEKANEAQQDQRSAILEFVKSSSKKELSEEQVENLVRYFSSESFARSIRRGEKGVYIDNHSFLDSLVPTLVKNGLDPYSTFNTGGTSLAYGKDIMVPRGDEFTNLIRSAVSSISKVSGKTYAEMIDEADQARAKRNERNDSYRAYEQEQEAAKERAKEAAKEAAREAKNEERRQKREAKKLADDEIEFKREYIKNLQELAQKKQSGGITESEYVKGVRDSSEKLKESLDKIGKDFSNDSIYQNANNNIELYTDSVIRGKQILDELNASLSALKRKFSDGVISEEDYKKQRLQAYNSASDSLYQIDPKELTDDIKREHEQIKATSSTIVQELAKSYKGRDTSFDFRKTKEEILNEQIDDLTQKLSFYRELGIIKSDEDFSNLEKELNKLKNRKLNLELKITKTENIKQLITSFTSGLSMLAGSLSSISNAWRVFNDEEASTFDRLSAGISIISDITNTFFSLGQTINLIATAIKTLGLIQDATSKTNQINTATEIGLQHTKVAANSAEAISGAVKGGAALPFPANFAAITLGVGTVLAILANLPKFEGGGIVGGSSFNGDKNLVRVNSGEWILNRMQQKKLHQINEMTAKQAQNINLVVGGEMRVKGTELVGLIEKIDRRNSRTLRK